MNNINININIDKIFSDDYEYYEFLILKLSREIERLLFAQDSNKLDDSLDHALNGAITAFHLLEWLEGLKNPETSVKMRSILDNLSKINAPKTTLIAYNAEKVEIFHILHDVVTQCKHRKVSSPLTNKELNKDISKLKTKIFTIIAGKKSEEFREQCIINFGEFWAYDVLQQALNYFISIKIPRNEN